MFLHGICPLYWEKNKHFKPFNRHRGKNKLLLKTGETVHCSLICAKYSEISKLIVILCKT